MVGEPGFEPGASSSQTKRATKLRHSPYQYMSHAGRCRAGVTYLSLFELDARVTRDFAQLVDKNQQIITNGIQSSFPCSKRSRYDLNP